MSRGIAAGAAALWLLSAAALGQAPEQITLDWSDAGACPDDGTILAEALQLAGQRAHASDLRHFDVRVEPLGGGELQVTLEADGDERRVQRTLRQPDCEQAKRATALLVALALNPDAAPGTAPQGPAQPATTQQDAASIDGSDSASETDAADPADPADAADPADPADAGPMPAAHFDVGLGGVLGLSVLPGVAPGVGAAAGIEWGSSTRLRLQLGIDYLPPNSEALAGDAGAISLQLLRAVTGACLSFTPTDRVQAGPCAAMAIGRIAGQSQDIARPASDASLWLAPELGAQLAVQLDPWVLRLTGAASLPLLRARVVVGELGPVFEVPQVGLWVGLGVFLPL